MQSTLETTAAPTARSQHSCVDLAGVVLTLRDDLHFTLQHDGGSDTYLIEDPARTKFYRVGIAEFTLISLIDGHITIAEAHGLAASALGAQALSDQETAELCRWLVDHQLASTPASLTASRMSDVAVRHQIRRQMSHVNLISPKLPLGNPDRVIQALSPLLGWWFSPLGCLVWTITIGIGLFSLLTNIDRIELSAQTVVARDNWIWLAATWLLLKSVHEIAHGLACKRFGGTVREFGVVLFMLLPLPYVDVTAAWRFRPRYQRIITSAAGVLAEFLIAAVAAILWSQTTSPLVMQHAFNAMLTGSLITLLFNANPLMRFDGYYILTDLLLMPNLATQASQRITALMRQFFFGIKAPPARGDLRTKSFVLSYGIAAMVWRVGVCLAMLLFAEKMLWGAGVGLALIALTVWFVLPAVRVVQFVIWGSEVCQPNRRQFGKAVALVSILIACVLALPWYGQTKVPAIVDFDPLVHVRAPAAGFVKRVACRSGDTVSTGQVLLELENLPLQMKVAQLDAQAQKKRVRARVFAASHQTAAYQVELEQLAALESQLHDQRAMLSNLVIRASQTGIVIGDQLDSLPGTYIKPGETLMDLGPQGTCRVKAFVPQRELEHFAGRVGDTVGVFLLGSGGTDGCLEKVNPRGDTRLPHPALSATAGGPIATLTNARPDGDDQNGIENVSDDSDARSGASFKATEPYFSASIRVDDKDFDGQLGVTGWVGFRSHRGTVGNVLAQIVRDWFAARNRVARFD